MTDHGMSLLSWRFNEMGGDIIASQFANENPNTFLIANRFPNTNSHTNFNSESVHKRKPTNTWTSMVYP
jgi:hypothetical protein